MKVEIRKQKAESRRQNKERGQQKALDAPQLLALTATDK
jgi:hypothetical protein